MVKRSYVSLSFASPKKLQLAQLSSDKKKIKKSLTLDIPPGLIKDSRVQDTHALAALLKGIWKKMGLKEKSVGIVVSESATFTKTLKLPKLPTAELDEAISWQASDFLPVKASEVVMDWKLVKEDKEGSLVLVVSITKDILKGYVSAAAQAGLLPLVVETPSLGLSRFLEGEKGGHLIVYGNFDEVLLIVSEGRKIVGSSVVSIAEVDEIVKNAARMVRHYSDIKVVKVSIGGPLISQDIAKRLQDNLKVPVEWIKTKVTGLEPIKIQEYLIPISLQLKDPARPADETTVNLLPPELVTKYDKERMKLQIWSLTLLVSLIVWISFFATLGVYLFFVQQVEDHKSENILNNIPPEQAQVIEEINEINAVSASVLKISAQTIAPQTILNLISDAKPTDVSLLRYRIDLDTGAIDVIGTAATRQSLIDFKDSLEETTDFSLVQIPLTSFEKESDLQFSATFTYLPAITQSQPPARPAVGQ